MHLQNYSFIKYSKDIIAEVEKYVPLRYEIYENRNQEYRFINDKYHFMIVLYSNFLSIDIKAIATGHYFTHYKDESHSKALPEYFVKILEECKR